MSINVLLGKTLSGKSTVSNILEKEHNLKRIVSFTTRPKRPLEEDGIDYMFFDSDTVLLLIVMDKVVALRSYQPHIDYGIFPWYYGFIKNDLKKNNDNSFIITDLKGLQDIRKEFKNEEIKAFYIDVTREEQLKRLELREESSRNEQLRRLEDDDIAFREIYENVDFVLDANKTPEELAEEVINAIRA